MIQKLRVLEYKHYIEKLGKVLKFITLIMLIYANTNINIGMNEVATIGHDLSSLAYSNRQYGNTYNNASNIPSSISPPASISSSVIKSSLIQQQSSSSSSSSLTLNHDINVNRIAHLILVDQKLNNTSSHSNDGVDIIVSTISESILADSYAMKMNDNNLNTNSSIESNNNNTK